MPEDYIDELEARVRAEKVSNNLLTDTLRALRDCSKKPSEVIWVGSKDGVYAISWDGFEDMAKTINYHSGYGTEEIALDLVVVGTDWWLERHDYDGAEWWEFKQMPIKSAVQLPFSRVCRRQFPRYYGVQVSVAWMNAPPSLEEEEEPSDA